MTVSSSGVPTPPRSAAQPSRPRVPRNLGTSAGIFALAVLGFGIAGALWGMFRPVYTATVAENGALVLVGGGSTEFTAYITFALFTGVLAAVTGILVFAFSPETRGVPMLLWVGAVAFIASVAFLVVGDLVATLRHPTPEDTAVVAPEGDLTLAAFFHPGVAWLLAPFMAIVGYWFSVFTHTPDPEQTGDALVD